MKSENPLTRYEVDRSMQAGDSLINDAVSFFLKPALIARGKVAFRGGSNRVVEFSCWPTAVFRTNVGGTRLKKKLALLEN